MSVRLFVTSILALFLLLGITGCARSSMSGWSETGHAQSYPATGHGRTTASGQRLDNDALTAGHVELPFDAVVRVTNLTNGRAVVVRINDRVPAGGEVRTRLTRRAAAAIGGSGPAMLHVRIEVLE